MLSVILLRELLEPETEEGEFLSHGFLEGALVAVRRDDVLGIVGVDAMIPIMDQCDERPPDSAAAQAQSVDPLAK